MDIDEEQETEERGVLKNQSGYTPVQDRILFRITLAIISGLLLGFSFPPSPFSSLAYIAFIPFFYLFIYFDSYGSITKYSYLFLMTFHILTLYWTGGYIVGKDIWMMVAGAAVIFIHPFFYMPFILLAFFTKKRLGHVFGLIAFALFWTSFEFLHSLGEYSFPWITIGNSQAYDLNRIQIIEYISVYGLTLLIFAFNIFVFILLWKFAVNRWKINSPRVYVIFVILFIIYFGPIVYGNWKIEEERNESQRPLKVGVLQPNFDPWDKWGTGNRDKWDSYLFQLNTLIDGTKELSQKKPGLIIWPETAIPFHILMPRYFIYLYRIQRLVDTLNIPLFTGLPTIEYFDSVSAPATSQKVYGENLYVESYNSTILLQPFRDPGPVHQKTILVPFAERIPYAETFKFLIEPLKWNVGISSWGKGGDTLLYTYLQNYRDTLKFSGMVCYESAYPNYVREFVNRGAQFLIVVTNDSWWGRTSGAYQHASMASLRAVETRRWVIQCANGGISMIVDPSGKSHYTTELYTKSQFTGNIYLRSEKTFYVEYGDIVAELCLVISVMMLISALISKRIGHR